jgi:hypothetical protein
MTKDTIWAKQSLGQLDDRFFRGGILMRPFDEDAGSSKLLLSSIHKDPYCLSIVSGETTAAVELSEIVAGRAVKRLKLLQTPTHDAVSCVGVWQGGADLWMATNFERRTAAINKYDMSHRRELIDATQGPNRWLNQIASRGYIVQIGAMYTTVEVTREVVAGTSGLMTRPSQSWNGRLVVAGSVYLAKDPRRRGMLVACFDRHGNLDPNFRIYGGIPKDQPEFNAHIVALAPLEPTKSVGRILALVNEVEEGGDSVGFLVHLAEDGTPLKTPNWPPWFSLLTCAWPTNDKETPVLIGGAIKPRDMHKVRGRGYRARICRMTADAEVDMSYGAGGSWICPREGSHVRDIYRLFNGDVIACGSVGKHPALFRLDNDGVPDESFGDNGVLVLDNVSGVATSLLHASAEESDDRLAVNIDTDGDGMLIVAFRIDHPWEKGHREEIWESARRKARQAASASAARRAATLPESQSMLEGRLRLQAAESHAINMGASAVQMADALSKIGRSW